jgi:hypothetical protein
LPELAYEHPATTRCGAGYGIHGTWIS